MTSENNKSSMNNSNQNNSGSVIRHKSTNSFNKMIGGTNNHSVFNDISNN